MRDDLRRLDAAARQRRPEHMHERSGAASYCCRTSCACGSATSICNADTRTLTAWSYPASTSASARSGSSSSSTTLQPETFTGNVCRPWRHFTLQSPIVGIGKSENRYGASLTADFGFADAGARTLRTGDDNPEDSLRDQHWSKADSLLA